MDVPCGSDGKESAFNEGEPSLTPGSRRFTEEGMVTHCSVLAWKIPWTKADSLQFMDLK